MFKLFKKRQQPSAASGIWIKVGQWVERKIRLLADKLNRRTAHWSRRSIKIALISFCAIYMACFGYYFLKNDIAVIPLDYISVPDHAIIPDNQVLPSAEPVLSHEAYRRLLAFRHFLDSLQQTPEGQPQYEKILSDHPGIRDSVEYIISLYKNQDKNVEYGKDK